MVQLHFYNFTHFPELSYQLDETQILFTAEVTFALNRVKQRAIRGDFTGKPFSIIYNNRPAGFFVLDFGDDKTAV